MEKPESTSKCPVREQACVASAAAIVSSKWTPQLIYALYNGVQRFCELQKEAGGINPRTLSARLDELAQQGIVQKVTFAEMPPRVEYSLTQKGKDLIPILECMVEWGEKYCMPADADANMTDVQPTVLPQSAAV
jgi:DNA-binding HxlR family transcriptional regulator